MMMRVFTLSPRNLWPAVALVLIFGCSKWSFSVQAATFSDAERRGVDAPVEEKGEEAAALLDDRVVKYLTSGGDDRIQLNASVKISYHYSEELNTIITLREARSQSCLYATSPCSCDKCDSAQPRHEHPCIANRISYYLWKEANHIHESKQVVVAIRNPIFPSSEQ